jgi:hypothetical protein
VISPTDKNTVDQRQSRFLAEISSRSKSPTDCYFTEANKKIHFFPPGFTSISSKEDMPMNINIEGLPTDRQLTDEKINMAV